MVLKYYGINVNWNDLEDMVLVSAQYRGERVGFSTPQGVASGLRKNGLRCNIKRGSINSLKYHISGGNPAIVLLRTGTQMWHWVVVIGYDTESICLADPYTGTREWLNKKVFESSWGFESDMDGESVGTLCSWCNGKKKKFFFTCDLCFGKGYIDPYKDALRSAGVYSYTYVLPKK
jgi:ABC-type bacteriocin/lantibiotic exporter with double-glycine peptidase domain